MTKLISKNLILISIMVLLTVFLFARLVWGWTNPTANPPSGGGALYYYNGNVGIATTTPGSPLTVAGVIYSSTGGFKFPDNTTQTTAASGGLGGSGTINYIGKFTGTGTIGNSQIFDNGTSVGIGTTNTEHKLNVNGTIRATTGPTLYLCGTPTPICESCPNECTGQIQTTPTCIMYLSPCASCSYTESVACSLHGRLLAP